MPGGVDVEMYLNRPYTPECYGSPIITPLRRHKYSYNCRNDEERCRNLDAETRFYKNEKISIANELNVIKSETADVKKKNEELKDQIEYMKLIISFNNERMTKLLVIQSHLKESDTKVAGLERENAILKKSVKEKDKSLKESDTKVAGLERENAILKQSVKEKDKRIERITTTMQIGISEFETGLCELAFEQRAIRTQFPNHSRHLTRDRQYEETSSNTFYELRYCENCDKCWQEISDLKAEVKNLQDRYTQKEVLHQKSMSSIVCLEAAIDRLKSDIISYKGEKELLNIAVTNLKREKTALEGKIREHESRIVFHQQNCYDCGIYKNKIYLKAEVTNLLGSKQTSENITTRQLQKEISQLKSTIASHQRENEKLSEHAKELKKEKHQLEEKISRQTSADITTRRLQAEIIQLKSTIARHETDNEKLNEQAEELKKEKRTLENKISRQTIADITTRQLQAEIVQLKSTIARHVKENENINEQAEELKQEKRQLEERISSQTSADINIRQLQAEIVQLKSTISRHVKENEKLNEHAKELNEEKQQLEERISRQASADITIRQLQAEIVQLKSTIARHVKENEKLDEHAEELKKEKHQLEERIRQSSADITTRQLQAEIVQLKSTIARHVKENENINEQAEELKQEKRQLEERISRQSSADITTRQLQAEIAQLKSTIARHVKENEKLNEQAKELKKEKRQLEEKIRWKRTEDLFEESEKNKSHLREEIVHLKSDNVSYKNDNDMLKTQATQLKKEIQMLEEKIRQKPSDILFDPQSCQNCRKYTNEIFDLKAAVSRCKQTAELLENSEKKTRQLQDKIIDLQSDNVSYQKDIEKHKIKEKQLENEIHVLEGKLSKASSDLLTDARDCQLCCKYRTEISDLKVEVNKLRDRLSEAAGNKLRDGNPNIADLSDMNRPTSLAEKFSSLYTDEYTDAMEVIEGTMDEQASVLFLLQLLQSCYDWSRKLAEEQRHMLSVESFGFMKKYLKQPIDFQQPDSFLIHVKEFQKKISADGNNLGAVEMICLEDGMKQTNLKSNQNMKKYMKKCSLLCWMMQISDPPIYLNFDVKVGEKLDKNVYNVFTKSGSEIEFLVWPAMYIHRTGPMLAKGVAQGK